MTDFSPPSNASPSPSRVARQRPARTASGRSLLEFHPLLPGEERLMQACQQGEVAELGDQLPDTCREPDDALRVRAPFLRFLLLGGDDRAPVHEHGVQLVGAIVEGLLDLAGCRIPHSMCLKRCRFTGLLLAQDAAVQGLIMLEGSCLPEGINADRLQCDGGLYLRNGFRATGVVRLLGALIGGALACDGGQFEVEEGDALSADGVVVNGGVFFNSGFKATGAVRLLAAVIGGNLECGGGQFEVKEGAALSADGAVVKGDVFFDIGFKSTGEVRLLGVQIGGDLACCGGQIEVKDGSALLADGAVVKGGVFFSDGFKATGAVRAPGAQIGGDLTCSGGQFEVEEGAALSADRAVVKGCVFFDYGFRATGAVRLPVAQIGGDLVCSGGLFEVEKGHAFLADGAVVKGNVVFNNGFKAAGAVRLLGVQIGGALVCSGGQFEAREGDALSADGVVVKGNVFFNDGFKATGEVRLLGAQIGGDLTCCGGQFEARKGAALLADGARVEGGGFFRGFKQPMRVNASHMQVAVLVDTIDSWAEGSVLDGLRYGAFGGGAPTLATARLEWLRKQPAAHLGKTENGEGFRPQPWRSLQAVLREMGHAEEARQIGIAFEQQLRKAGRIGGTAPGRYLARAAHALFGILAGYGYRPMWLMAWMVAVWLICGMGFWFLALPPHNAIGPSDPLVFQNERYAACVPGSAAAASRAPNAGAGSWYLCQPLPAEYSTFSPLVYSLDIMLPLVNLGQENAWGPLVPTPQQNVWSELRALSSGHVVRLLVWFETLFGWVGGLLLVSIVSGFARRTEE